MIRKMFLVTIFVLVLAGLAHAQDTLTVGEPTEGTAKNVPLAFTFDAKAGQGYTVALSSTDFDSHLAVTNADGDVIGENEDFNYTADSQVLVVAAKDETLTAVASAVYGDFKGAFTLTVTEVDVTALEYGSSVDSSIDSTTGYYQFVGKAGDIIDLKVVGKADDSDTQLSLQLNGTEVTYDSDGGLQYNPFIHAYQLAEDGTYVVVVSGYSDTVLGDITVSLAKAEPLTLKAGDTLTITLGKDVDYEIIYADFVVGTLYTLDMSSDSPSSYYIEIGEEGSTYSSIYYNYSSLLKNSATFPVSGTGTGKIKITNSNYDEATVTVTLSGE